MEKGCILPNDLLTKIIQEESVVLSSLARFCACSAKEIVQVLEMRNVTGMPGKISRQGKIENTRVSYGYRYYTKKTAPGKRERTIVIPEITLKKIQEMIKQRLASVPVSLSAMWGKPGDSDIKNTELHKNNPYWLTMDIKQAYDSIDTHRVYKHFEGALGKLLKIQLPLLKTAHEKELFLRALTHLCVWQNKLPQWASTSTQIQNMVMASFDAKVETKLPELVGSHMIYSRLADDMAFSFPHFRTKDILQEKMSWYKKELGEIFRNFEQWDTNQKRFLQWQHQFKEDTFILTDSFELEYLMSQIELMKETIAKKKAHYAPDQIHNLISIINQYKQRIRRSERTMQAQIKEELMKIVSANGRKINQLKTKIWTPQSGTVRELHWITYTSEGKRGLTKKDRSAYTRLFKDLAAFSPEELEENAYYQNKFSERAEISPEKIIRVIDGIWSRCTHVYSATAVPVNLQTPYHAARTKRVALAEILNSSSHQTDYDATQGISEEEDMPF